MSAGINSNSSNINNITSTNGFTSSQHIPKNRNTPKSMIGLLDTKKNAINTSILAANQYCNKPMNVGESISNMFHKSN
jgi:hypothetical protein